MTHPIITSMIVECKACGKIHESMPIAMPIAEDITAVFFSCTETHRLFMSDSEEERINKKFAALEKQGQQKHMKRNR